MNDYTEKRTSRQHETDWWEPEDELDEEPEVDPELILKEPHANIYLYDNAVTDEYSHTDAEIGNARLKISTVLNLIKNECEIFAQYGNETEAFTAAKIEHNLRGHLIELGDNELYYGDI